MKFIYLIAFALSTLYIESNGLKILGIIPFPSKSHFAIGNSIIMSLLDAGHDVTVLSPYPDKTARKNYRQVDASKILDIFESGEYQPLENIF